MGRPASERREDLVQLYHEVKNCQRCPLHATRTQVVFGSGNADADLMFVGEAPGFHEDQQGKPFVGAAGKQLDKLLAEIGMERADVFIANVLKSRPPGNRDPELEEIESCKPYLTRQIELIEPLVICTLGNFSTKLLTRRHDGITRVHGRPQDHVIAGLPIRLYPIYHPAAGLRSGAMLEALREDFKRLPELLEAARPQPEEDEHDADDPPGGGSAEPVAAPQLGLFG
ncbi:MAG TPA: uracil-DNA glycosylase [Thermoleophilaceae bacterium]|nr:uracil-DNA glycosylase [Thermoleophilaceae bacterium]